MTKTDSVNHHMHARARVGWGGGGGKGFTYIPPRQLVQLSAYQLLLTP